MEIEITVPALGAMCGVDFLIFEGELLVLCGKGKIDVGRIALDGHLGPPFGCQCGRIQEGLKAKPQGLG